MKKKIVIQSLTQERFKEAVDLVMKEEFDPREEVEHHLEHLKAHYVAMDEGKIIGVIGWYQDNVHYADTAMADKFPGEKAYWVGYFAVDKNYRGKGIGFALINKLEQVVRSKNAKELWVVSVPRSKHYYQRQGFKLIMKGEISGKPRFFLVKSL